MKQGFKLDGALGYFQNKGVDVMAFDDFYPAGHQSGVSLIMHGNRIASNGDLRISENALTQKIDEFRTKEQEQDANVGLWPLPEQGKRDVDAAGGVITTAMQFAVKDPINYTVTVKSEGASIIVSVDLEKPVPKALLGKLGFNLELFPGVLFGKIWMMDGKHGVFPEYPIGPMESLPGSGNIYQPFAVGKRLVVQPDDPYNRFTVESQGADLLLYDARLERNNGWFTLSTPITSDATKNVVQWTLTPNVVEDWLHTPVVQLSQVGYHPNQPKMAIIELDKRDKAIKKPVLHKITETGATQVYSADSPEWGQFLRYNYLRFDFTEIKEDGMYKICYGDSESSVFRIGKDIYDRGVWQPVLEYFLPVQMCHMRVTEADRVWHGYCHDDDAQMAPVDRLHFDGYEQGPSTLTKFKPGDLVPGLNVGGWHDAGDDDLRVESQAGEMYSLALAYEAFGVNYDATTIDQSRHVTEIHKPDGKNDILQQIEHGALSVVGAYRELGRLYRGIITNDADQYRILGDPATQTDNVKGNADDRWVFTEDNPPRELTAAAHLAATARVLRGFNDTLSKQSLEAAAELFKVTDGSGKARPSKIHAAVELLLATGEQGYKDFLISETSYIVSEINQLGWVVARGDKAVGDAGFTKAIRGALPALKEMYAQQSAETPYGIPYRPHIWGAGWEIQRFAVQYYFLHAAYPDVFGPEIVYNALDFILGRHPGSNNMSFASGVGTKSATVAYGWNRADWSYVPGGVISGTALIRPDFPELLVFPFLWQQTEYVLGGGSSHYMFLVLAVRHILGQMDK